MYIQTTFANSKAYKQRDNLKVAIKKKKFQFVCVFICKRRVLDFHAEYREIMLNSESACF
jgi:hypothetical protein